MSKASDDVEVMAEDIFYEPTPEDVLRYASYVGADLMFMPELYPTVVRALKFPLPPGWQACRKRNGPNESIFYHSELTGESSWSHPLDNLHKKMFGLLVGGMQAQRLTNVAKMDSEEIEAILADNREKFCRSLVKRTAPEGTANLKFVPKKENKPRRKGRLSWFKNGFVRFVFLIVVHVCVTIVVYTNLRPYILTDGTFSLGGSLSAQTSAGSMPEAEF